MNQFLWCDCLPELARWPYLARWGLPALSRKKWCSFSILYWPTVRSRWLDTNQVLFYVFMGRDAVEVHKNVKKNEANIRPFWPYAWLNKPCRCIAVYLTKRWARRQRRQLWRFEFYMSVVIPCLIAFTVFMEMYLWMVIFLQTILHMSRGGSTIGGESRGCAAPSPEIKTFSSYLLLKFVNLASQLRHSLVVHPLLRRILDPHSPCWDSRTPGISYCTWHET